MANKISFLRQKQIKVTTGKSGKSTLHSFEWSFGDESSSSISTKWIVCEQFLAATSSVFESSLKKEWMHSKASRTFHFEDLDPGVFETYVRWLENRRLLDSEGQQ